MAEPVQLDFSKAQPLQASGVSLDFSKAQPLQGANKEEQPGFLDKPIPLDSYKNATLSGVQSVGRGIRGAVQGIGHAINPAPEGDEPALPGPGVQQVYRFGKGIYDLGKSTRQVPGAIKDINASPDPLGTYAKVGEETAGQGAGQAVVALGTEGLARGVSGIAKPLAGKMYQSALKPSTTLGTSRVGRMIDTGLNEKIPVSEGGAAKLSGKIGEVNDKIADTINSAPTRGINKFKVASRLGDTAKKFGTQVNPESDLEAIGNSGNEFLRNQPGNIPGPDAQALKQGTYRQLRSKYGELGSAATESQKALARGLKEELVNAYPELKNLNATDSRLIDLHEALEKAVLRSGNREPLGIGGPVIGAATRAATGSSALGAGAWMLKEALRNPLVKSRLAIALNTTGRVIGRPGVGASIPIGAGASQQGDDRTTQR